MATIFQDSVGGQTLTATGTVTEVSGTFSGAQIAVGGSLSTGASASFNIMTSFSAAIWFKVIGGGSDVTELLRYREEPSGELKFKLACDYGPGENYWNVYDNTSTVTQVLHTSGSWSENVWHLAVVTYNASTLAIGYSLDGGAYETATMGNAIQNVPSGTLSVADLSASSGDIQASMCAFWTRVLSETEVAALYNEGTFPIKYPFA